MTDVAQTSRTARARPFPWGTLDVVAREDAAAARALHRWTARFARAGEVAEALSALLDARVEVLVKRVRSGARSSRSGDEGVAVILAASDAPEIARAAFVEVDSALAAALVGRALHRIPPRVVDPGATPSAMAGALAAVVAAAGRRVHARRALRVLAAGPASSLGRDFAAAAGEVIDVSLTVLVDDDAFSARVLVARDVAMAVPDADWTRAALASLGDVPLTLAIVAAASRSTAADVGTLRRGDAWLPSTWSLTRTALGALTGPVLLAAPSLEIGLCATLGDDGRLVLRGGTEDLSWGSARGDAKEGDVSEPERDALVEAVGEVPVVVRVEIGVAEMRAREWAALGPGDVVALGRKIGEAVTLRVSGVSVARGELVDLDGEVGVRILAPTEGR